MATTLCTIISTNSYIITWKVNGLCKSVKYEQKCTFSTHKKWHAVCSDNKNCLILMPLNEHFELNFTKFKLHSELKLNLWWTFKKIAELGAGLVWRVGPSQVGRKSQNKLDDIVTKILFHSSRSMAIACFKFHRRSHDPNLFKGAWHDHFGK